MYTLRVKRHIKPFEAHLATSELNALLSPSSSGRLSNGFARLDNLEEGEAAKLLSRLAYWESLTGDGEIHTLQHLLENTSWDGSIRAPRNRCLRYGPHGLHEYRGKFFPQLVKALLNIARIPDGGNVLDPMVGSGTLALEARLSGYQALGSDMNPLSVMISRAKCDSLELTAKAVVDSSEKLRVRLRGMRVKRGRDSQSEGFLTQWFPLGNLNKIYAILSEVERFRDVRLANIYKCALSDVLRSASYQDPNDLRIRRRKDAAPDDVAEMFLDRITAVTKSLAGFLQALPRCVKLGDHSIKYGDARHAADIFSDYRESVDAIVTSPPYATALPYLDTDRLSLAVFELCSRAQQRSLEQSLIGSRDRSKSFIQDAENRSRSRTSSLFPMGQKLIDRIHRALLRDTGAGFRRRNLPGLLTMYLEDMDAVFAASSRLLRPGRPMFLVIGDNRTRIGGRTIEIRTADLLQEIAEHHGFEQEGRMSMDMLPARDLFAKNAISSETILHLRLKKGAA